MGCGGGGCGGERVLCVLLINVIFGNASCFQTEANWVLRAVFNIK